MSVLSTRFETDGYLVVDRLVDAEWVGVVRELCEPLLREGGANRPGARRVLERQPRLADALAGSPVPALVREVAGLRASVVRSILFDKSPESNWSVPWHQDAVIAVRERVDVPGFGPWSVKDGEPHCRPPLEVMDSVLVVRVHLDACGHENGPLRLVPGSHRRGLLSSAEIESAVACGPAIECCTPAGGAVVMRPHTVHSSPRARIVSRRRVLHLEYCGVELPGGLTWAEAATTSHRTLRSHG